MSEYLTGRVLIAMPAIGDPRFERAVVLMCAHDRDHAMGVTLNDPIEGLSTADLLDRLGIKAQAAMTDGPVLFGGPVDRDRGIVVHTDDYLSEGSSQPVGPGVVWTATRDVLEAMGDPLLRPRRALVALGYAGWGAGQLEREIQDNVWLICEPDEDLLFGLDHDLKWAKALAKIGVAVERLSSQSGRA